MTQFTPRLPPLPDVDFDDRELIHDTSFGDSYFSRDNGLEESRTVFLQGCQLREAWRERPCFTLGELGFGTGLNFLASWQLWRETRSTGGVLHYVTTEAFLMTAGDAARAHAHWPELADLSDALIEKWPVRAYGVQRIWFLEDQICLTILIGDATQTLMAMDFEANAWFLDGFAPSRNSAMWSPEVLSQVARLCAPGARLASYSVAGSVRRNLEDLGFCVRREPGFGSKRQRLEAIFPGQARAQLPRPRHAIVVGGGIAGAAACDALFRRGVTVDLFDGDACGQTKASHNPAALVMPRLDRGDTREARFFRQAYLFATAVYREFGIGIFDQTGVHEIAKDDQDKKRVIDLGSDPPFPPELLTFEPSGHLFHRTGGLVYPHAALAALTKHARHHPRGVAAISFEDGQWYARDTAGIAMAQADLCVIAAGPALETFVRFAQPLEGRLGQISLAPVTGPMPTNALAGGPYAAPFQGQLIFGATYAPWDLSTPILPSPSASADQLNKTQLGIIAPELSARIDLAHAYGRVSVRTVSPDKIPIAGAATLGDGSTPTGLYVLGALGSRGFTTAHLLAEYVASIACGEFAPMEREVVRAITPERFVKRALKKAQAMRAKRDRPTA